MRKGERGQSISVRERKKENIHTKIKASKQNDDPCTTVRSISHIGAERPYSVLTDLSVALTKEEREDDLLICNIEDRSKPKYMDSSSHYSMDGRPPFCFQLVLPSNNTTKRACRKMHRRIRWCMAVLARLLLPSVSSARCFGDIMHGYAHTRSACRWKKKKKRRLTDKKTMPARTHSHSMCSFPVTPPNTIQHDRHACMHACTESINTQAHTYTCTHADKPLLSISLGCRSPFPPSCLLAQ
mmetsp:Transcript_28316/g.55439  ORF Transcript_28316/g.55439 Transcript_28316/m.55439 type:complete len:241 (-) Transcript_28316:498-1220(-)